MTASMARLSERTESLAAFFLACCCPGALALAYRSSTSAGDKSKFVSGELGGVDLEDSSLAGCSFKSFPLLEELLEMSPRFKIHVHLHKAGGSLMCMLAEQAGERSPFWDWVEGANCNWMHHDDLGDSGLPELLPNCSTRRAAYMEHGWTYTQIEREITDGDLECDDFATVVCSASLSN